MNPQRPHDPTRNDAGDDANPGTSPGEVLFRAFDTRGNPVAIRRGEVWSVFVAHDDGCPALHSRRACTCNPDVYLKRGT